MTKKPHNARTEKDFQWLFFAAGMVLGCQEIETAREVVLKILEWTEYEIDEQALERFDKRTVPYYSTRNVQKPQEDTSVIDDYDEEAFQSGSY